MNYPVWQSWQRSFFVPQRQEGFRFSASQQARRCAQQINLKTIAKSFEWKYKVKLDTSHKDHNDHNPAVSNI